MFRCFILRVPEYSNERSGLNILVSANTYVWGELLRFEKKRMTSVHVARSLHLVSAILLRLAGAYVAFTHQLSSASRLPSPFVFILRGKTDSVELSDAQPPCPKHSISLLLYIRHFHLAFPRAF